MGRGRLRFQVGSNFERLVFGETSQAAFIFQGSDSVSVRSVRACAVCAYSAATESGDRTVVYLLCLWSRLSLLRVVYRHCRSLSGVARRHRERTHDFENYTGARKMSVRCGTRRYTY